MAFSQEKSFIGPKILAERPRQPSAMLLNGAPWEPTGNSVSSPEKLKPVYLPRTHGSPKRVNLQSAGGRIIAVSHSTAPVSSYKRVVFRARVACTPQDVRLMVRTATGGRYSGLSTCQPCCVKDLAPINRRLWVLLQPKSGIEPPSPATFNCG